MHCEELIIIKYLNYPSIGLRHPRACCLSDSRVIRPSCPQDFNERLNQIWREFKMTAQSATAMQPTKGSVPVSQNTEKVFEQFERVYDSISRRAFELFQADGQVGHELD